MNPWKTNEINNKVGSHPCKLTHLASNYLKSPKVILKAFNSADGEINYVI